MDEEAARRALPLETVLRALFRFEKPADKAAALRTTKYLLGLRLLDLRNDPYLDAAVAALPAGVVTRG